MRLSTKWIVGLVIIGLSTTAFASTSSSAKKKHHHHRQPVQHHYYHYHHHYYHHPVYHPVYHAEPAMYKGMAVQPCPMFMPKFKGFYVGANVGASGNFFSVHDAFGHTINQGEVSPLVGLFAGYGHLFAQYNYLGAEIYANTTLGDATSNTTVLDSGGTHIGLQTRQSYGASIIPGMVLTNDVLGYIRIGAVWTKYYALVNNAFARHNNNNTQLGWELGIGTRINITDKIDMRLEYDFDKYRSYYTTVNGYHVNSLGDRATLGVIYRFD